MRTSAKSSIAAVILAGIALCAAPAHAQFGARPTRGNQPATTGVSVTASATLDLPKGITKIISIDAHNSVLVEITDPDDPTNHQYVLIPIQHVYSGGIAAVFGGGTLPTAMFLSPAGQSGAGAGATGNRTATTAGSGTTAPFSLPTGVNQLVSSMQLTPKSAVR